MAHADYTAADRSRDARRFKVLADQPLKRTRLVDEAPEESHPRKVVRPFAAEEVLYRSKQFTLIGTRDGGLRIESAGGAVDVANMNDLNATRMADAINVAGERWRHARGLESAFGDADDVLLALG